MRALKKEWQRKIVCTWGGCACARASYRKDAHRRPRASYTLSSWKPCLLSLKVKRFFFFRFWGTDCHLASRLLCSFLFRSFFPSIVLPNQSKGIFCKIVSCFTFCKRKCNHESFHYYFGLAFLNITRIQFYFSSIAVKTHILEIFHLIMWFSIWSYPASIQNPYLRNEKIARGGHYFTAMTVYI